MSNGEIGPVPTQPNLDSPSNPKFKMPTEFEMRRRNEKFARDAREGKKPTHLSRQEKLAKRSPIGSWALGAVLFVSSSNSVVRAGEIDIPIVQHRFNAFQEELAIV
ncbi:hypothetical protein D9757_007939 [Collybiopsis confluens]|uniref:Stress-associated endoplasmic reticulum protein n=1 Tax=Collybiopsis confluens TaxID=2823264 RepID=A0A8H5HBM2_9AGAR|nr:hypothetical protein D9757_007939 [Collybiopsis confluens]